MRNRIVTLSVVVFLLSGYASTARATSAQSVQICDESGFCGACCVEGANCQDWCDGHCTTTYCTTFPNPICCDGTEVGIVCGDPL
jgi:hypothetical protein